MKNNPASKQYVSILKAKKGRRVTEYFHDFIGCQEDIDGPNLNLAQSVQ
jgi:nucleoid-associated protein